MMYLYKAFSLGLQILAAIENVKIMQPAVIAMEWKGKLYTLRLEQAKVV